MWGVLGFRVLGLRGFRVYLGRFQDRVLSPTSASNPRLNLLGYQDHAFGFWDVWGKELGMFRV